MGELRYTDDGLFVFVSHTVKEQSAAQEAGLKRVETESSHWQTRSPHKAVKLRRFAEKSAELKLKNTFITNREPPKYIPRPKGLSPLPHQLKSAFHCLTRTPAYCADEAGLGKTITSVLCMNARPGKTLIVCPPFLKYNWVDEINKWSVKELNIAIAGPVKSGDWYDVIIWPDSLLTNGVIREWVMSQRFEWLFIDEAHRFKHATSKRTTALVGSENDEGKARYNHGINDSAKNIVLLSGTPFPNGRPMELFHMLTCLAPEAISWRNREEFGRDFCGGIKKTWGREGQSSWNFYGSSNLSNLRKELKTKLMIRHTKASELKSLPAKTRKLVFFDAPKELSSFEQKLLKEYTLDELMDGEERGLGAIAKYRALVGSRKIEPAVEYVVDQLENSDDKLVVFARHIDVVEGIRNGIKKAGYGCLMIRGGMSARDKSDTVKRFQSENNKHRAIVLNMDAGGVGITLTRAPGVVIAEPEWVPGVNEQAEDRVHRIGQSKNVYVRYLVLRGTLDEVMLRRVMDKQKNIDEVLL